ncbi:ShlB/FhaC/HecB family hemolysin secretion/activation protein [Falsiroseomonas oryziterrae]|uniref:ShlB/FhaC/HecB family hemolysin secretion/activation protein n=1 Tax=Falsiroseomonas oryziterrae TaxID=2911368 RepID=UPI001F247FA9|nr:ShlB/FhaC/HecB family hemolysin secretion/activation protein [Roseomonas sp. NPKOSM-4]
MSRNLSTPDRGDGTTRSGILAACLLVLAGATALPGEARAQSAALAPLLRAELAPVELHGVTLYERDALLAYAEGVALQEGAAGLPAIAAVVERLYHEDGWFLARARAFQDPASGRRGIVVDEGGVRRLEVIGVAPAMGNRIASYLTPVLDGSPLGLDAYERALMLAGDLSGVALRSEFVPDPASGEYRLAVHAQQRRSAVAALVDNVPRANAVDGFVSGEVYSLLTPGDMARVVVGATSRTNASEGGFNGAVFYRAPIGDDGLYAEAFASNLVYTREFPGATAERRQQRGEFYGALLGYPLRRRIDESLYVMLEADHRAIDVDGSDIGADRSSAIRLAAYYTSFDRQAPAFRLGLTLSLGTAYSSWNPNVDDSFWHLRAVAGTVLRLGDPAAGYALRLEGYAKYSPRSLPETERLYLGDRERMRGYGLGTATGDSGAIGTLELSRHIPLGWRFVEAVTPSVFLDAGAVRRNDDFPITPPSQTLPRTVGRSSLGLASAGLGWNVRLAQGFAVSGWVGVPLVDDGTDVQFKPAAYLRLTKAW